MRNAVATIVSDLKAQNSADDFHIWTHNLRASGIGNVNYH
jgi:hypothetical protein